MFPRRIHLGTILGLLVLATTIPLGLFAVGLIRTSWQQQRALVDRQNIDTARAISVAIDQEVRATIAALNVLSALEAIDEPRRFYPVASQMLALRQDWEAIRLVDAATGSVVVNTQVPFGTSSSLINPDWIGTVRGTGRPTISTLRQDPASRLFVVSIGVPVVRGGTIKYVLGAQLRATTFSETVRRQATPPGGVVTLLDATPVIIARSRNEDRYVGHAPTPDFVQRSRDIPEDAWRSVLLEGTPAYSAYTRSPLTGWTVGIGLPAEAIDGPIRRSFFWLTAVGVAILAGGIALAVLVRRRIVQAQVLAARAARALAAGEAVALPRSSIIEVHDLSQGLQEAATILGRRLQERNDAQRQRERASVDLEQALVAERDARTASGKNEARLAVTLRSIADAVITTDDRGHVTMLNPVAQALTGWTEGDAIGQPIERVFTTAKDPAHQSREATLGRPPTPPHTVAAVSSHGMLRAKDGRQIPVAESTAPILAPDGSLLGAVVVFRDVTAEREADRQRAALLDREQAARRAAEGLSRAKDEFVATVSHELRTPLNAIFGWVAMLRAGTLDVDRQRHALDVIHRNTIAQAQLIEDLLDMSRVVRGTVRLDMQPIDLAVAVDAAVDTLLPTATARQIAIHVQADRGSAIVSADLSRMQQVVWNLLSNSLKFTPPGGQVDVRLEVVGDEARLNVTDSGEGIAPEFLPHVFDRFRQETADVTRVHSGLGIGLSLVRHLTELHGGSVAATSNGKGHGATFSIRLPLLGARAVHVAPPAPGRSMDAGPQPLLGRRLLIVDDDSDARELIGIALSHGGASVTAVESVAQALDSIAAYPPDAVITDIAMPNETGFDLVRRLRADDRMLNLPIVAITAYNRGEDRDRALAGGFDAHVGKPFDPRAIVALIAGLVEERAGSA